MGSGGLSCGATMAKYVLFIFNIVFFLCGGIILGVTLWLYFDESAEEYMQVIEFDRSNPFLTIALVVLIMVGVLIFVTGFLGCCGAWKENSTMLFCYAGLLVLILLGQVLGIGMALGFRAKLDSKLKGSMSAQAHNHVRSNTNYTLTRAWYAMQFHFECCGGTNYQDYLNSKFANETDSNTSVPATCCKLNNTDPLQPVPIDNAKCQQETNQAPTSTKHQLNNKGCYDAMIGWLHDNVSIVIGVLFAIVVIEIVGIIFACCVRKELTEYKQM